jgi:hypothetical protein
MSSLTRHAGTWSIEDMMASPLHYLPVEVAPGTAALRVTLSYPRDGGAVLDLGCFAPSGFRGWSGGARSSFVISGAGATPGYLAGEVAGGLWQVAIGLYRVPAEGVGYSVTAEAIGHGEAARWLPGALAADGVLLAPGGDPGAGDPGARDPGAGGAVGRPGPLGPLPGLAFGPAAVPAPAGRPERRSLPAAAGRRWLAGDLHAHTVHSDGVMTVPELAAHAVERGLDFVAVTDHNTVSHHRELGPASAAYGVTLIPGQEVTTSRGHAGVLGDTGWIDFRRPASSWLEAAERGGGLLSVNHPFAGDVSWLHPMTRRPPLLEVWHWSWLDPTWTTPLSWWQAWDPSAIPVGGSDWHRPGSDSPLGTPTTWVEASDRGVDGVLAGLRAGRVAISASRNGPVLLRHDDGFAAVGADGLLLAGPDGPYRRIAGEVAHLPGRPGYHRLLTPSGATVALTP